MPNAAICLADYSPRRDPAARVKSSRAFMSDAGLLFKQPKPLRQPPRGRCLNQDRDQDGHEHDRCDHRRARCVHAEQQTCERRRNNAGLARPAHEQHFLKTPSRVAPAKAYRPIRPKSTCAPSRMKIKSRMMNAVVTTNSASLCASPASIRKPKTSLLPSTMPNTNTAMNPEACRPLAAK